MDPCLFPCCDPKCHYLTSIFSCESKSDLSHLWLRCFGWSPDSLTHVGTYLWCSNSGQRQDAANWRAKGWYLRCHFVSDRRGWRAGSRQDSRLVLHSTSLRWCPRSRCVRWTARLMNIFWWNRQADQGLGWRMQKLHRFWFQQLNVY